MKKLLFTFSLSLIAILGFAQKQDKLLFGVAYYDEYMPYDRLDKDIEMMKDAGINVVRIAESTWSTVEPQDNVWDFKSIDRVLNAMHKAGIKVIVGTPTYAFPTWLAKNTLKFSPPLQEAKISMVQDKIWTSPMNISDSMPRG